MIAKIPVTVPKVDLERGEAQEIFQSVPQRQRLRRRPGQSGHVDQGLYLELPAPAPVMRAAI
jgi:hypothetical protein